MLNMRAFMVLATHLLGGSLLIRPLPTAASEVAQKPLPHAFTIRPVDYSTEKNKQDNTTCPTYGEAQYTGTIKVRDDRELYYWYVDSRSDASNDPLLLWINGGPGSSSMTGLFTEVGPCWLDPNAKTARPNPWAWNNNASVLYLEQPAGSGLSSLANDAALPSNEQDTAKDFEEFLNIFFTRIFPDKKRLPLHMIAESYGGHYGPVYLQRLLRSKSRVKFASLVLINSVIDWTGNFMGVHELLCIQHAGLVNATACQYIKDNMPEQQRLGAACNAAYGGKACVDAFNHGMGTIQAPFLELIKTENRYMANINKICIPVPYYPFYADPDIGNLTNFMNQDWVKRKLGMSPEWRYQDFNMDIQDAFKADGAFFNPTTRELAYVLDAGTRVLVINGNLDNVVNTPGAIIQFDSVRWQRQQEYKSAKWRSLPMFIEATGQWKATRDGSLAFVTVDGAGHTVPSYVRKGSLDIVQEWLRGGWKGDY